MTKKNGTKFVTLHNTDGVPIALNPAHVVRCMPTRTGTDILLVTGFGPMTVREKFERVVGLLHAS
jgi:hypothetical protein